MKEPPGGLHELGVEVQAELADENRQGEEDNAVKEEEVRLGGEVRREVREGAEEVR